MTKSSDGVFFLTGKDFTNAGSASSNLKGILDDMGIPADIVRRAAIAAFEAEMNAIIYAVAGMMRYSITPEAVTVTLQDMGPGIPDIDLAMKEGYSTAPDYIREMGFGSGMGLPNIKKNTDKLTINSVVGEGTTLEFVIYLQGLSPETSG
ncbi:MAG TPA: ATP-binding protein [Candidatus Sulfobium mesophilum]|jgi:anti-sigma regulatory factor (Ser/Thr protein kinase)|uniref:Anti-sigma regulatory factor n=1 Tax=Candidatus Sulfobium mesophilum TaxID=2016548 RepID=A0A2U3QHV6_9BACT